MQKNNSCPQLIFLDINMPVMNGFEFIKAYEKSESYDKGSVIVMMLTTSVNSKDIENANHPYISGFLSKPLTKEMVQDVMEKYF
jgi:CheY-like chemotaxis protein